MADGFVSNWACARVHLGRGSLFFLSGGISRLRCFCRRFFPTWSFGCAYASRRRSEIYGDRFFLIALFVIPHSVMARFGFKRWLDRFLPAHLERSTYVLVSSLLLFVMWQWQPIGPEVWHFDMPVMHYVAYGVFAVGWIIILVATFLTDHFDLFGLRQVYLHMIGQPYTPPGFIHRFLYRTVRHPMMLGMFIALWATPVMTLSHFVLAIGLSLYIAVGVRFEERDLLRDLGENYQRYHAQTPMFLPGIAKRPEG